MTELIKACSYGGGPLWTMPGGGPAVCNLPISAAGLGPHSGSIVQRLTGEPGGPAVAGRALDQGQLAADRDI